MHSAARLVLFVISTALLTACDVAVHEVDRVTSPDHKVDLVIVTTDGGATTSVGYHLILVPHGDSPDLKTSNFVADKVHSLKVEWIDAARVSVQVHEARIFHFSNFWHSGEVDNWRHIVQLSLKEGRS